MIITQGILAPWYLLWYALMYCVVDEEGRRGKKERLMAMIVDFRPADTQWVNKYHISLGNGARIIHFLSRKSRSPIPSCRRGQSLRIKTIKGVLINSEKVCNSAHSRCSYLTTGEISTCWGIQFASYPDVINENFMALRCGPVTVTLAMLTQYEGFPHITWGFSTLNANFNPTPVFPATRMSTVSYHWLIRYTLFITI